MLRVYLGGTDMSVFGKVVELGLHGESTACSGFANGKEPHVKTEIRLICGAGVWFEIGCLV